MVEFVELNASSRVFSNAHPPELIIRHHRRCSGGMGNIAENQVTSEVRFHLEMAGVNVLRRGTICPGDADEVKLLGILYAS